MADCLILSGVRCFRVPVFVLSRHWMGSTGCRAARLKTQSIVLVDCMRQNPRRLLFPPVRVAPARELVDRDECESVLGGDLHCSLDVIDHH